LLKATSNEFLEKFGHPKLILSIAGGTINFQPDENLQNTFKLGILKPAKASRNLWIFTDGMDVGIGQLFGESVANDGLNVIGMTSYNRIETFMKLQVKLNMI